jgi:hypothetical protein
MTTREQISQDIAEITAQLKGPMPNIERALLVADRDDLRQQLADLHTKPLSNRDLAVFLKSAIEMAAAAEPGRVLGVTFIDLKIDESDYVRAKLSDGSLICIDMGDGRMVPDGYFGRT